MDTYTVHFVFNYATIVVGVEPEDGEFIAESAWKWVKHSGIFVNLESVEDIIIYDSDEEIVDQDEQFKDSA
jgi:hypothetical protein